MLKQALVIASERNSKHLLEAVVGILFFSVPIKFSSEDSWNTFLGNIHLPNQAAYGYTKDIATQNHLVALVHKLFGELFQEELVRKPSICSICETLPVYRMGVVSIIQDIICF